MKKSRFALAVAWAMVFHAAAAAQVVLNSANGHYYELMTTQLPWSDANAAAALRTYGGVPGHLATISDASENSFLQAFGEPPEALWIGGRQATGSTEPASGWYWITGEPWSYSNWNTGEPNNAPPGEDSLQIYAGGLAPGRWNDEPGSRLYRSIVEYDVGGATTSQPCDPSVAGTYEVKIRGVGCLRGVETETDDDPIRLTLDTSGCRLVGDFYFFGLRASLPQTTWSYSNGVIRVSDWSATASAPARPGATAFTMSYDQITPQGWQAISEYWDAEDIDAIEDLCGSLDSFARSVRLDWRLISRPTSSPPGTPGSGNTGDNSPGSGDELPLLSADSPIMGLSAPRSEERSFRFTLESGHYRAVVSLEGGTGQADLILNLGSPATAKNFYKSPSGAKALAMGKGTSKSIMLTNPPGGEWYGTIRAGKKGFSDVTVRLNATESDPFALPAEGRIQIPTGNTGFADDLYFDVELGLPTSGAGRIDSTKSLWVVVHGRLQTPIPDSNEDLRRLASVLSVARPGDQVLFYDWSEASDSIACEGASRADEAGVWLAAQIRAMGITPRDRVNLVGHSWGTWVCYYAARSLGGVNSIIALDPAIRGICSRTDYQSIDFASVSDNSWAFHSSGLGSEDLTRTAHEAYSLNVEEPGRDPDLDEHSAAHLVFRSIVSHFATGIRGELTGHFRLDGLAKPKAVPRSSPGDLDGSIDAGMFVASDVWIPLSMATRDGQTLTDQYKDSASPQKPYKLLRGKSFTNFLTRNLPHDHLKLALKNPSRLRLAITGRHAESLVGLTIRGPSGNEIIASAFPTAQPDDIEFEADFPTGTSLIELRHLGQTGTTQGLMGIFYTITVN